MTRQAPHVAALKRAFHAHFNLRANVREAAGPLRPCLYLSIPSLADQAHADRVFLVQAGAFLETHGFYQCHDYACVGLLSSPSGWTCWKGGHTVLVQYHPNRVQSATN